VDAFNDELLKIKIIIISPINVCIFFGKDYVLKLVNNQYLFAFVKLDKGLWAQTLWHYLMKMS